MSAEVWARKGGRQQAGNAGRQCRQAIGRQCRQAEGRQCRQAMQAGSTLHAAAEHLQVADCCWLCILNGSEGLK